jgi:hypothetical protein
MMAAVATATTAGKFKKASWLSSGFRVPGSGF